MCHDLSKLFNEHYDRLDLKLELPKVFDLLKSTDAQFEMVTSNTLQQLSLVCNKNKITCSYGVVFVNTKCKTLEFTGAKELGDTALDLHIEGLELEEFSINYVDLSKSEIIKVFDELEQKAKDFETEISKSGGKKK